MMSDRRFCRHGEKIDLPCHECVKDAKAAEVPEISDSETVNERAAERRAQRRYEIAREVMAAKYAGGWVPNSLSKCAKQSVEAADALLKALEGE